MHEVSLMQSALELAEEHAREKGATRIHAITLRIGRLAGVELEALDLAFEMVAMGTTAEGATLKVESVEVVSRCSACSLDFTPIDFIFRCPECGEHSCDVSRGRELELASLEVS
jgi:hydrogenase nickel incorporation protein HypA/HybF